MQRAWLREFNSLGLQLRPQAAKLVTSFLLECEDPQQAVEKLVENTKALMRSKQGVVASVIDADLIQDVISCMLQVRYDGEDGAARIATESLQRQGLDSLMLGDGISIYNAFTEVRPFDFQRATKAWVPSAQPPSLFPGPAARMKIYRDRYLLLLQRTLLEGRLVLDSEAKAAGMLLPGRRVLTPVESLVGNPGKKLTFGLISRELGEGRRWVIEDLHKVFSLQLDVQESDRLLTDGSFVLAEGELVGETFKVHELDVPSAVPRRVSLEKDQVPQQAFGGNLTDEQLRTLERYEMESPDGMYVVLCEVHLDSARVLEKLGDLFDGYEQAGPPAGYVFMGSFCSTDFVQTAEGVRAYRDNFERLKLRMQRLEQHVSSGTRFVFLPGPNDPGGQTLPRMPLPDYLTANLAKEMPGVVMATNPCRMRHFSRELVFFRHDVLRLLRRHEVVHLRDPEGGGATTAQHAREEMVRFLLDQAHLVPLPLQESNILWEFDHTLRLYPLPHAVFVGGIGQPFDYQYQECRFCSVGPFHRDAEFYAFHPVKDLLESCEVPDPAG